METKCYAKVIEDNGGGLSLYIMDSDTNRCIFAHSGYEYRPGCLIQDLETLKVDDSIGGWEGNDREMAAEWATLDIDGVGRELVAELADGKIYTYPEAMGHAARLEFRSPRR